MTVTTAAAATRAAATATGTAAHVIVIVIVIAAIEATEAIVIAIVTAVDTKNRGCGGTSVCLSRFLALSPIYLFLFFPSFSPLFIFIVVILFMLDNVYLIFPHDMYEPRVSREEDEIKAAKAI